VWLLYCRKMPKTLVVNIDLFQDAWIGLSKLYYLCHIPFLHLFLFVSGPVQVKAIRSMSIVAITFSLAESHS
jgi:hypothetical protein